MTVAELIEKLKEMPGDLPVACAFEDSQLEIFDAEIVKSRLCKNRDDRGILTEFVELI